MGRARLRDLGITIGDLPTGPYNAITDVPGILVGHTTVIHDEPRVARTGVTVILPREGRIYDDLAFAGLHVLNGFGEMTGSHWIEDSGLLSSAIGLTSTMQVGLVRDEILHHAVDHGFRYVFGMPVVAETFDGWLNDVRAFPLTREHVHQALDSVASGPVPEGNVGGGTGMICHEFKGGIGTSSRVVRIGDDEYTVGVLVQANHGTRHQLRVDGVPVGREIGPEHTPARRPGLKKEGSIIVVVATNAPLVPNQCRQLAQRATIGTAHAGNAGHYSSGDIFLAFSTANHIPPLPESLLSLTTVPHTLMNPLYDAVIEATEESILNALTAAETMTGFQGRTVYEIPLDELQKVITRHRPMPS